MRRSTPSATAQNVALARAHLTHTGVLHDPWARTMLRPRWAVIARAPRRRPFARWGRSTAFTLVAARTRFYDDAVRSAVDQGVRQVVVLAAGYDSRAWRLARPGVRFFEVDHPATRADKRRRAPAGGPRFGSVDLETEPLDRALLAAGLATDEPALFTVEGLTMYLGERRVRALLTALGRLGGQEAGWRSTSG
ncbi:class I SAM-dependent methyltransferase [Streptoalloteichus hindustanus]|uniref:S-adenosyl-L-methionine-dependent methyltransferase n=1 Tax=Streptoalloteichus hindustanus TaxID=2017 RepID=A0A1M5NZ42_STRHI|nr:class I SAM-dependent methyltransferase [Streptoalloteichus hindustanus]SHG94459.1 methyltransferase, TIGR00027 family [Streptoalloteichus hindustanus]